MSLLVFDMPEKPAQIASWLERHVMDVRLPELVAELEAVNGTGDDVKMSMERSLDTLMAEVLTSGLSVLGRDRLKWFLQYPEWLFDLQERVFVDGGPYWDRIAEDTKLVSADVLQRNWATLKAHANSSPPAPPSVEAEQPSGTILPAPPEREPTFAAYAVIPYVLTAAASIVAVLGLQLALSPPAGPPPPAEGVVGGDPAAPVAAPPAWGWNRPDALDARTDREYLLTLASSADEWFKKRPDTSPALAKRILSFRTGCSRLLLEEHELLSPDDRRWLKERCRAWADQLNDQLARLEEGEDARSVRNSTDQTITKLVNALRDRAGRA